MTPKRIDQSSIEEFWNTHPCGEQLVDGARGDFEGFFERYDAYRYSTEKHILDCLDEINVRGKTTLEIGLGQGADSEQLIRRGARWSGLDLTQESVSRVTQRLALRKLPFVELRQGSVLEIPYADREFDVIYSHGVLHHVPDILRAQRELHRVIRPDGKLVVMLYAKRSLNYVFSIGVARRLALLLLYPWGRRIGGLVGEHIANARREGILRYLRMENFVHRNTDGPHNPYSKVYDLRDVEHDFPSFRIERAFKRFMHAPPLPLRGVPGEEWAGWHLWVHLRPR